MSAISVSNLVEFVDQVRLILATGMKFNDNCVMGFVLCAVFSEIS